MVEKIIRVTLFKVPSKNSQLRFVDLYKELAQNARKDGKPYILSLEGGPTHDDARNQGYTFAAKSEFASMEDMQYYDTECAAHQALKVAVKDLGVEGVMTVFYEPQVIA